MIGTIILIPLIYIIGCIINRIITLRVHGFEMNPKDPSSETPKMNFIFLSWFSTIFAIIIIIASNIDKYLVKWFSKK